MVGAFLLWGGIADLALNAFGRLVLMLVIVILIVIACVRFRADQDCD